MINLLAKVLCITGLGYDVSDIRWSLTLFLYIFQPSNIQFNRSSLYAYFWWGRKRHHNNDFGWKSADFEA